MFRLYPFSSIARSNRPLRTLRTLTQVVSAALCLSAAVACGGDDSDSTPATKPDAGTTKTAGQGGSSTGSAGNMSVMPPQPVACGSAMCTPPSNPLSGIASMFGGGAAAGLPSAAACCLDESKGTCGITTGMGAACEALATPDPRCPAADLGMLGAFLGGGGMAGCCIDNMCGQDGKMFGRGCVPNSQAMSMVSSLPLVGGMIKFPPSLACDRPADKTGDDAGVHDDKDAGK
jgi:hypothetical protein